jgi:hypothetical protein
VRRREVVLWLWVAAGATLMTYLTLLVLGLTL